MALKTGINYILLDLKSHWQHDAGRTTCDVPHVNIMHMINYNYKVELDVYYNVN